MQNATSLKKPHNQAVLNEAETLDNSGNVKITPRQNVEQTLKNAQNVDLSHGANFEQELDRTTTYKDIKDIKDQADFQNQQIVSQFSKHKKDNE